MAIIKAKISPYSSAQERLLVGDVVEGEFVQDKSFKNVLDDSRLKTSRTYGGPVGKRGSTHYYTVEVPEGYPQAIAKKRKTDLELTIARWAYEILYHPGEA